MSKKNSTFAPLFTRRLNVHAYDDRKRRQIKLDKRELANLRSKISTSSSQESVNEEVASQSDSWQ